jgi:hypothetical protein
MKIHVKCLATLSETGHCDYKDSLISELDKILISIGEKFGDQISGNARNYLEIDIGRQAEMMGFSDLKEKFQDVNVIVPLKNPVKGMKVRIDGRTFVNYAQFESGIAVPGYVTSDTGLPCKPFMPNDSMILNF